LSLLCRRSRFKGDTGAMHAPHGSKLLSRLPCQHQHTWRTKERIACLCGLWGQKGATTSRAYAGANFQQTAYDVLYKYVGAMRKVLVPNCHENSTCNHHDLGK